MLLVTVLVVAANLRPAITVVGPLIETVGADTGLTPTALGLLGSIPIIAFAAVSPFVHLLGVRFGLERTIFVSLLVLTAGTLLRSASGLLPGAESGAAGEGWLAVLPLYAGTALLSAAIGVGNVLVPAVVKRDFPDRVALMTGVYTAALVAAAASFSAAAVPLAEWLGWEGAFGSAAALALAAAAVWALRGRPCDDGADEVPLSSTPAPSSLLRQPLAWQVTLFFGLQSTLFYVLLTWFPAVQTSHGIGEAQAGYWLGLFQAIGVVASLVIGQVLQRSRDQRIVAAAVAGFMIIALAGMILAPALMPLWALSGGISSGSSLMLGLTFISLRASSPTQVGRLSGMAQGFGYLLAAAGPVLAGMLYEAAGSWTPVLLCALAVAVAQLVMGLLAGRSVQLRS